MKFIDPNAAGRAKYQQMWAVTADVIRKWDPHGLLAGGASDNELDHEITSLVAQIPRIKSATDATHAISRILSSSFEPGSFPLSACQDIGEKLFATLLEQGLLE
jgi:hypothetical protein